MLMTEVASANVAYANLGARLSLLGKNNETQTKLVQSTFDTLNSLGLIDENFNVFDGTDSSACSDGEFPFGISIFPGHKALPIPPFQDLPENGILMQPFAVSHLQFSWTAALALEAAAVAYNSTGGDNKWKKVVDGLVNRTVDLFFPDGVAKEIACESRSTCTVDMTFFKSFLHRSLASTAKVAPYTAALILPVLKSSAAAAVKNCTGGDNGRMCGLYWSESSDVKPGAGSQVGYFFSFFSN
jgi:mannan endo-1,6-alpha-mannosidase